jgi:hypothetical protein
MVLRSDVFPIRVLQGGQRICEEPKLVVWLEVIEAAWFRLFFSFLEVL